MRVGDDRPFISWLILVYDRTAEERFPFKGKWYRFNYARATEAQAQDVIQLCRQRQNDEDIPHPKPGIGETRVSLAIDHP